MKSLLSLFRNKLILILILNERTFFEHIQKVNYDNPNIVDVDTIIMLYLVTLVCAPNIILG